ncbi:hypothetical protein IGI04_037744 [Brassica rapa subsp. trilocularis]|uniref:Strictosidine synthase conserved region domain-containing protein n=1 Tax=Brassica rapa subsp. trilocularis TaxID=1813537 RepID=A0ABQ7LIC3_BRACM|nr:hypothetical protein IGI04_037744 [Brassica rapa subsp. trilocularis]
MTMLTVFFSTAIVTIIAVLASLSSQKGSGVFAPPKISGSRDVFPSAKVLNLTGASGPESIAFDPSGEGPYVGVSDGRVLKWRGESLGWSDFAYTSANREKCVRPFAPELEHVCGRPLGLRFDEKTGDLYIADAYFGLMIVGPAGGLAKPLVTEAEGQPFRFTNDLDIDEHQDVIYFTDTSTRFQRRQFLAAVLNVDKTGRLIKYDRTSKKVTVLVQGIAFANGVALSKDRSFVLVAETTTCKILRLWLSGPNAGAQDVFAELPGFPDNIRRNSNGEFWVALHSKKGLFAKLSLSQAWFRDLLLRFPISGPRLHSLFTGGRPHATAMKLSESGEVLEVLEDREGKRLRFISEVEEKDGKLWIGSVLMPFLGCKLTIVSVVTQTRLFNKHIYFSPVKQMPTSQKAPTWAIAVVLAVFAVISYQILFAPDDLKGTKNILPMAKTIPLPVDGPESIEWDPQGEGPYAAVVDGRILKWRGHDIGWVEFAYTSPLRGNCSRHEVVPTCGRPLGLSFEKKTGDLYICDGYLGVMKVGPEGGLAELVVDQAEGRKVMFANQMDIDEEEDVLYFNDSSDKYHFRSLWTGGTHCHVKKTPMPLN